MSRQNKVNPGMYTQRGRLAQDDAAREIARQRAIGSRPTWQPVQRDRMPKLVAEPDHAGQEEAKTATPAKQAKRVAPARRVQPRAKAGAKPAARKTAKKAPARSAVRAKAKTASGARGKAKSARPAAKAAARRTSAKRVKS